MSQYYCWLVYLLKYTWEVGKSGRVISKAVGRGISKAGGGKNAKTAKTKTKQNVAKKRRAKTMKTKKLCKTKLQREKLQDNKWMINKNLQHGQIHYWT